MRPEREVALTELLAGDADASTTDLVLAEAEADPVFRAHLARLLALEPLLSDALRDDGGAGFVARVAWAMRASDSDRFVRRVTAQLKPRQRARWGWLLAALALVTVGVIARAVWPRPVVAELFTAGGSRPLHAGEAVNLEMGDRIHWSDGTIIEALGGANMRAGGRPGSSPRLEVQRGVVRANVAKQVDGSFTIATQHGDAVVLGTGFQLNAGVEQTLLLVDEGRVRFVTRAGSPSEALVDAGTYAVGGNGAGTVALPQIRLLRDPLVAQPWRPRPSPQSVALRSDDEHGPNGGPALRLSWRVVEGHPSPDGDSADAVCPFALGSADDVLVLDVRVARAEPTRLGGRGMLPARLVVELEEADGDCWRIGACALADLPSGWQHLSFDLAGAAAAPSLRNLGGGDGHFDAGAVSAVVLGLHGDAVELLVADAHVIP